MTTQKNKKDKDVPGTAGKDIAAVLSHLMAPYQPASSEVESDAQFTTNEIIAAIEQHYGWPQGDADYLDKTAGITVVNAMQRLGFVYKNTGGLQLQWLLKKKTAE